MLYTVHDIVSFSAVSSYLKKSFEQRICCVVLLFHNITNWVYIRLDCMAGVLRKKWMYSWVVFKRICSQLYWIDLYHHVPWSKIERCEVNVLGLIIHKSQHIELCGCAARSIKSVWYKFLNLKGTLNQNCFKLVWFV